MRGSPTRCNDTRPQPEIYFVDRSGRDLRPFISFDVRTRGEPATLVPALRHVIQRTNGAVLIGRVEPLAVPCAASLSEPRFAAMRLTIFAGAAVAIATVGLFSVLSYSLAQRRRELGIRAALGADRRALVALVVRGGLRVTIVGAGTGLAAAPILTRFMQAMLFGVRPLDPLSFAAAPAILLVVVTTACLLPAVRAARVHPSEALRAE